jgi:hypothetical protein
VIQSKILTPVASLMISEGMLQGGSVSISMKKDELYFDVKKRGKGTRKEMEKTGMTVKA